MIRDILLILCALTFAGAARSETITAELKEATEWNGRTYCRYDVGIQIVIVTKKAGSTCPETREIKKYEVRKYPTK